MSVESFRRIGKLLLLNYREVTRKTIFSHIHTKADIFTDIRTDCGTSLLSAIRNFVC
jgi:hypothetical protein